MSTQLKKILTPFHLWGLGVGYVISGMYFGWNLGLQEGGTSGMIIATFLVILLYISFCLSYAELACSIPKAGGAFDYANSALGKNWGFIAGLVQIIEFVFAPPAIALGIGAYFHLLFTEIPSLWFAVGAYFIFTFLNIYGIKSAASFEMIVMFVALFGLLLFATVSVPHFNPENVPFDFNLSNWSGVIAATPFAIWFFLGIEGIANLAEESIRPQKDITLGFGYALLTLIILCIATLFLSVGIGGWQRIVFDSTGAVSDSPLPLALGKIMHNQHWIYQSIVVAGTLGLIASFHGLLLSAGRATFEMGRIGYAPVFLGKIHKKFQTPHIALLFNMTIGVIILLSGKTGDIIIISVFGALALYIISMVSLLVLRKKNPMLPRPFRVPFFPYTTLLALFLSTLAFLSMCWFKPLLAVIFLSILLLSFILFKIYKKLP